MQELIQLIRQQLVLCLRLLELMKQQTDALVRMDAASVQRLTKEIEVVVIDLNKAETQRQAFLKKEGAKTVQGWLATQPISREKAMAMQLVRKQGETLGLLKQASHNNKRYLDNNMTYINYNVNVMTGAVAGATYGASEASGANAVQGRKMFEANI